MSQNPDYVSWTNLNYKPADHTKITAIITGNLDFVADARPISLVGKFLEE